MRADDRLGNVANYKSTASPLCDTRGLNREMVILCGYNKSKVSKFRAKGIFPIMIHSHKQRQGLEAISDTVNLLSRTINLFYNINCSHIS